MRCPTALHPANTIYEPEALRRELEGIRERGFALDLEEHEPGVRCVACPVRGPSGTAEAAISVAGPAHRLPDTLLAGELAVSTKAAAQEIGRRLGALPESRREGYRRLRHAGMDRCGGVGKPSPARRMSIGERRVGEAISWLDRRTTQGEHALYGP